MRSENPIIGRNPVEGVARIFNSAVMPYGDEFIGVFRGEQTNGIPYIYMGASIKMNEYKNLLQETGLKPEEIMYMGDDIPDYEVMQQVGLPACPADASPEIKAISTYISYKNGGCGCGRDVIEQVLKAQNKWMADEAFGW